MHWLGPLAALLHALRSKGFVHARGLGGGRWSGQKKFDPSGKLTINVPRPAPAAARCSVHGNALRWLLWVEDSNNEHIYHSGGPWFSPAMLKPNFWRPNGTN